VSYLSDIQAQIDKYTPKAYRPNVPSYLQGSSSGGGGMTPSQLETLVFAQQEKARQERRRKFLQPLEVVFDILNMGQYATANIGQEVLDYRNTGDPIQIGQALKGAITRKQKGDWKDVLFGEEGFIPWEPETKGGKVLRGVTGFLANVLLDPTTYIGFGPAKGARTAATTYADDAMKLLFKQLGTDVDLAPKLLKGISREQLEAASKKGLSAMQNLLEKNASPSDINHFAKAYKKAYKTGLRPPATQLEKQMADSLDELTEGFKAMPTPGPKDLAGQKALFGQIESGMDAVDRLAGKTYGGAGTRGLKIFGQDIGATVGERYPMAVKGFDQALDRFANSKVGSGLAAAVRTVEKYTGIGKLKEMFGVRDQYQRWLRNMEMDTKALTPAYAYRDAEYLQEVFKDMDQKTKGIIRDGLIKFQGESVDARVIAEALGEGADDATVEVIEKISKTTNRWYTELQQAASEKLIPDTSYIENYIPVVMRPNQFSKTVGKAKGVYAQGFQKARKLGHEGNVEQQVNIFKWLFGMDDDMARKYVNMGASPLEMDIQKMLNARALAQAKTMERVDLLRKFKEFGVDSAVMDKMAPGVTRSGIEKLNLTPIDDPALKGLLFDSDVAEILERAVKITASDRSLDKFVSSVGKFNAQVKGWLTMSPGFHLRNMFSNNFTGMMKFGPRWLNPEKHFESYVATLYGLYGEEGALKALKRVGVGKTKFSRIMAKEHGGKTLRELADEAVERGVVTRATMGFDYSSTVDEMSGIMDVPLSKRINPLSNENAAFKVSHDVGNVVESTPRFQSFMMDFEDLAKTNPEGALDFATWEAKKWWLDYQDLTGFEQKVMKNIIPFYSWMRKNIANQFAGLAEFHQMYSLIPKLQGSLEDESVREFLPEYMRETGYFALTENVQETLGVGPSAAWPNLPPFDLNKLPVEFEMTESGIPIPRFGKPGDIIRDIVQDAHPFIKSVMEVTSGKDIFYQTDLGKKRKAPGITAPVLGLIDGTMKKVGMKGLDVEKDKDGNVVMEANMAKLLEENVPMLKQLEKYLQFPNLFIPVLDKLEEKPFSEDDKADEFFRALSFFMGIKLKAIDLEKLRKERAEDMLKAAEEEKYRLRKSKPGYQRRSDKFWQDREKQYKRYKLY